MEIKKKKLSEGDGDKNQRCQNLCDKNGRDEFECWLTKVGRGDQESERKRVRQKIMSSREGE